VSGESASVSVSAAWNASLTELNRSDLVSSKRNEANWKPFVVNVQSALQLNWTGHGLNIPYIHSISCRSVELVRCERALTSVEKLTQYQLNLPNGIKNMLLSIYAIILTLQISDKTTSFAHTCFSFVRSFAST